MRTLSALGLVALCACALGCHEYSLRLRDFDQCNALTASCGVVDGEVVDAGSDGGAPIGDAGDAGDAALPPGDADAEPSCGLGDASACDAEVQSLPSPCDGVSCPTHAKCVEDGDSVSCQCLPGFTPSATATECVDQNECMAQEGPCDELTTCDNDEGSFTCSACPAGYGGDGASGCRPLLASLLVTPQPVLPSIALDVEQTEHVLRFPLAVTRVGVTAAFASERTAQVLGTALETEQPWTSPLLSAAPNWLPIEVREGAREQTYVLEVQRGLQEAYIKASNSESGDAFGTSVAISGDTLVVGAPLESGAQGGVGATQSNGAFGAGAVYVFARSGSGWVQEAYLKANDPDEQDAFGARVVIDGDTIAVSAPNESSAPRNPEPTNNDLPQSGAVYVFVREDGQWSQQAMLKASNADDGDLFGGSIALSNDTIVVGAPGEDSSTATINGNEALENAMDSGAAYVFVRTAGTWAQEAYLKSSNAGQGDHFGHSVAISGNTVIASATQEDGAAAGVNGDQESDGAMESGAAYVFERSAGSWTQTAYLKSSHPEYYDMFGSAVAFDGTTIVIGAPAEDSSKGGINAPDDDDDEEWSGAAYVFTREQDGFRQVARIKARLPRENVSFGIAVAVRGQRLAIGAIDDSAAELFGGNDADDSMPAAGGVYLFEEVSDRWRQLAYVKPAHPGVDDLFGASYLYNNYSDVSRDTGCIALDGDTIVVGAMNESSEARGVDGNAVNEAAPRSGAVYVFR